MRSVAFILFFPGNYKKPGKIYYKGYASRYGRLDVYARTVLSLGEIGYDGVVLAVIRVEGEYHIVRAKPRSCANLSEREIVINIARLLKGKKVECPIMEREHPERILYELSLQSYLVRLSENGRDISRLKVDRPVTWIMGAHKEPEPDTERIIRRYVTYTVSIGPLSYLASHTAVYIAWREGMRYAMQ